MALWTGCTTPSCLDLRLLSINLKPYSRCSFVSFWGLWFTLYSISKDSFHTEGVPKSCFAVGSGSALHLSVFWYTKVPEASEQRAHHWFIGLCLTVSIRLNRGGWTSESLRKNYHHHSEVSPPRGLTIIHVNMRVASISWYMISSFQFEPMRLQMYVSPKLWKIMYIGNLQCKRCRNSPKDWISAGLLSSSSLSIRYILVAVGCT